MTNTKQQAAHTNGSLIGHAEAAIIGNTTPDEAAARAAFFGTDEFADMPPGKLRKAARALRAKRDALEASNKELAAALRPFAEFADKWDAEPISGLNKSELYVVHNSAGRAVFSLDDCYAARAALATLDADYSDERQRHDEQVEDRKRGRS